MGGSSGTGSDGSREGGKVLAFPERGKPTLSRREIVQEISQAQLDLRAFQTAYHVIHQRVLEVKDGEQMMKIAEWSGTQAVMGSLDLAIHSIERTIEELKDIVRRIDSGEIPNVDE
jgi:hypothetical protein